MNKNYIGSFLIILLFVQFACSKKSVKTEAGFDDLMANQRELINDNIADNDTKAKLISIIEEVDKASKKFFEFDTQQKKKMTGLIKDYKTSREEFESEINKTDQRLDSYFNLLVTKRREMRSLCKKDEWVKIKNRKTAYIPGKTMED